MGIAGLSVEGSFDLADGFEDAVGNHEQLSHASGADLLMAKSFGRESVGEVFDARVVDHGDLGGHPGGPAHVAVTGL